MIDIGIAVVITNRKGAIGARPLGEAGAGEGGGAGAVPRAVGEADGLGAGGAAVATAAHTLRRVVGAEAVEAGRAAHRAPTVHPRPRPTAHTHRAPVARRQKATRPMHLASRRAARHGGQRAVGTGPVALAGARVIVETDASVEAGRRADRGRTVAACPQRGANTRGGLRAARGASAIVGAGGGADGGGAEGPGVALVAGADGAGTDSLGGALAAATRQAAVGGVGVAHQLPHRRVEHQQRVVGHHHTPTRDVRAHGTPRPHCRQGVVNQVDVGVTLGSCEATATTVAVSVAKTRICKMADRHRQTRCGGFDLPSLGENIDQRLEWNPRGRNPIP